MKKLSVLLSFVFCATLAVAQPGGAGQGGGQNKLFAIQLQRICAELELEGSAKEKFEQIYTQYHESSEQTRQRPTGPGANRQAGGNNRQGPGANRANQNNEARPMMKGHRVNQSHDLELSDEQIEKNILDSYDKSIKSIELKKEFYFKFKEVLTPSQINTMYEVERGIMNRLTEERNRRSMP
ncbi:MAG: hypothetical protein R3Y38_01275 [Rikenellaceae bacterium]